MKIKRNGGVDHRMPKEVKKIDNQNQTSILFDMFY